MSEAIGREALSKQLARKLFPLALVVGFLIAFIIPCVYFALEFSRASDEAGAHAKSLAREIANLASKAPTLWKFQSTKYSEILHSFVPQKDIMHISVLDENANRLTQYEHSIIQKSLLKRIHIHSDPAVIMFNNRKIGEVEVAVSAYPVVLETLSSFLLCAVTGLCLALIVYRLPREHSQILNRDHPEGLHLGRGRA